MLVRRWGASQLCSSPTGSGFPWSFFFRSSFSLDGWEGADKKKKKSNKKDAFFKREKDGERERERERQKKHDEGGGGMWRCLKLFAFVVTVHPAPVENGGARVRVFGKGGGKHLCACCRRWRCSCFRGRIFARNPRFGVCVYDPPAKTTVQYESARIILNVESTALSFSLTP